MKNLKEKKKEAFYACIITLLFLAGSIEEDIPTTPNEEVEDIIHWKQEATIEEQEVPTVHKSIVENIYFDLPLSHELQDFIFEECEQKNIAPAIIISMIEHESNYKPDAIGDNGRSFGLMQIQPKWNQERMERLQCFDLLDPYQNIKVGIDIVSELKEENPALYWVLMAYNGGRNYANKRIESGNISNYALEVSERAQELEKYIEN